MEFSERLGWLLLGAAVGFVLGYIVARLREIGNGVDEIKSEVDEIYAIEKNKGEEGITRFRPVVADVLLFGVLCLVVFAAFSSQKASNAVEDKQQSDKVALCQAGELSRAVSRELVEQIYILATAGLERPKGSPDLTKPELKQYNSYIDRVNMFREKMYSKIRPVAECAPYVADDNVKPPTSPYPHINVRGVPVDE